MTLNLVRLFTTKHRRYKLNGCFISYLLSFPPLLQSKHVKSDIEVNCINLDIYAPTAPAARQSFLQMLLQNSITDIFHLYQIFRFSVTNFN